MSANNINDQDYEDQVAEDQDDAGYDESYDEADSFSGDEAEEWADGDDEVAEDGEEVAEQPPQKKKSSVLTVIIILVVAIVGVLGFMVVMGGNAPAPEQAANAGQVVIDTDADQPAPANNTAPTNGDAQPQPTATNGTEPQQGILDNPASLNDAATNPNEQQAGSNGPVVTNDAPPAPVLGTDAAPAKDVVAAISPTVKPVSDFPTVDSIKKPAGDKGAEPVTAAPVTPVEATQNAAEAVKDVLPVPADAPATMTAPAPVAAVDTSAADSKLADIQGQLTEAQLKIADLQKDLNLKEAALQQEKAKAAQVAETAASANNDAEVEDLKAKVAELEAKLAQKTSAKAVKSVPERSVSSSDSVDVTTQTSPEPVVKKPVAVKAKPAKQNWTLKSASSTKAILSDKTTGDLKTVHVGDTVVGLGRIVSISDSTSAWVVKGTLGSVSE